MDAEGQIQGNKEGKERILFLSVTVHILKSTANTVDATRRNHFARSTQTFYKKNIPLYLFYVLKRERGRERERKISP